MSEGAGPLSGLTVIDLGQIYNAPYATLLLAYGGARVIKVEPRNGENLRSRGRVAGAGAPFAMLNSNKETVTLNLKHQEGKKLLERLTERADVLVQNFRPGVMESLGLSAEKLMATNPRLIFASGSGYGSTGPYRDFAAMDITIQAMSGAMSITGFPDREPVKAGPAIGDFLGGIHLYGAIVTALYERERTGIGTKVEVAMLDAIYPSMMSSLGLYFGSTNDVPSRTGNRHSGLAEAPYNVYSASDGYVALICVTDRHWRSLLDVMGRDDLLNREDLAARVGRVAHIDEVDQIVTSWMSSLTKQNAVDSLTAGDVPCAPVRELAEVVRDPHLHQRRMLVDIVHPEFGPLTVPHSPIRVGDYHAPVVPSRSLGQDNRTVFRDWLGLTDEEIDDLLEREVI